MMLRRLPWNGLLTLGGLAGVAVAAASCSAADADGAVRAESADTAADNCGGLGYVPRDPTMTDAEHRGRCTWQLHTAGTEGLYRKLAISTKGKFDLFPLVFSNLRSQRFNLYGVINDPGCKESTVPDENGLLLDTCSDPKSTGIMGLRKIPNPKFDRSLWSLERYQADRTIEPPFLVGATCGMCHVGFSPEKPPVDRVNPKWENLIATIGNQYLKEGAVFARDVDANDFRSQVLTSQEPGTSDTSRIATDHINNPNAINSIFNLADRPLHQEVMNDGSIRSVFHILKDGADSIGIAGASLRVYVNIGMCSDQWLPHHDPIEGMTAQTPLGADELRTQCEDYRKTEALMSDAAAFLKTQKGPKLANAPQGQAYLTRDASVLRQGKAVFAANCATCHSSKQPPAGASPTERTAWFAQEVMKPDFLDHNFLSDDARYPLTEIGTNAARALATNAKAGHIWETYSSKTYKEQPSPGTLSVYNVFDGSNPISFEVPDGGNGYYRTPSLVGVWATAPLLHNNALGTFNGDPSVGGRMAAFNDAIGKMLWPARRLGPASIKRTTRDTIIELPSLPFGIPAPHIDVAAGTPINIFANLDPRELTVKARLFDVALFKRDASQADPGADLLRLSQCPDLVEDGGHTFGSSLSDADKHALIDFLKTM